MNKLKAITDIYNDRQDEYKVDEILKGHFGTYKVKINGKHQITFYKEWIGFYEFLFNPKYGVFEVFGIDSLDNIYNEYIWLNKSTEEIIDYMYKAVK